MTRGQEKIDVLCECALTANVMKFFFFFFCVCSDSGAKEAEAGPGRDWGGRGGGGINAKLHTLGWNIVQYGRYISEKPLPR